MPARIRLRACAFQYHYTFYMPVRTREHASWQSFARP
jgi:hypothetical protein